MVYRFAPPILRISDRLFTFRPPAGALLREFWHFRIRSPSLKERGRRVKTGCAAGLAPTSRLSCAQKSAPHESYRFSVNKQPSSPTHDGFSKLRLINDFVLVTGFLCHHHPSASGFRFLPANLTPAHRRASDPNDFAVRPLPAARQSAASASIASHRTL